MTEPRTERIQARLSTVFESVGVAESLTGRRPLLLDDPGQVRMVMNGMVDLFFVRVERGNPVGPRHHCMTVNPGGLMFGISAGAGFGLLAVSAGSSEVRRCPVSEFEEASRQPHFRQECASLLDDWIGGLTLGAMTDELKVVDIKLEPEAEVTLDENKSLRAHKSVVWVVLPRECGVYMDRRILGYDEELTAIPVTSRAWMYVQVAGSLTIQSHATEHMLQQPGFWLRLREFHEIYIACARLRIISFTSEEKEAQRRQYQRDEYLQEEALNRLRAASSGKALLPFAQAVPSDLVMVCRAVADALDVTIKVPSEEASEAGSSALTVEQIARFSGLRVRKVALPEKWWKHDQGPLIGFLSEKHQPVALLPASPSRYALRRPGSRDTELVTKRISHLLEREALVFCRSLPARLATARELLAFGLRGCRRDIFSVAVMGVLGACLGLLAPVLTATVFDTIIPFSGSSLLTQVTLGLVAAALGAAAFELTKAFSLMRIFQKGNAGVQCGIWDRLLNMQVSFFRNYTAGDLAMRANGIAEIGAQLKGPVTLTALSAAFTSFNLVLMFYYSPKLAVTGAVLIAVALGYVLLLCRSQFATNRTIQALRGEIGGLVFQLITGIGKIRTAGAEVRAFARWALSFEQQVRGQYSARLADIASSIFTAAYSNVCTLILFIIVAFYTAEQKLSVGSFLAFNAAFGTFLAATLAMSGSLMSFLAVIFLYERSLPILKAQPEVDDSLQLRTTGRLNGRVEVNQVSFRYDRNGGYVLDGVSLRAAPGEFIAVVGPSGSGKSTLMRLLLGFESPEFGAIYFDGQEQSRVDITSLRRQMGVVLQNGKLIPGSVFLNISGPANLSLDDAWRAARLAGIEDDIRKLPMQMHTIIMEGGGGFSGGQKQRLMIARALAGNPRVLLFDEATSALDNRTQAVVSRSIDSLRLTRIVIAHRLSTIINADRIYVLSQGKIVQTGTYAELMAQEGLFKELATRQMT